MIRSRTNVAAFEGLISELKILIHLGAHVNILNLLGACTKGIHKGNSIADLFEKMDHRIYLLCVCLTGELLVIVEYCPFGNLRTFIINHRDTFVSQIDKSGNLIESDVENDADDIVTTRKLICWSFQIARGMDYLVTKKVIPSLNCFSKDPCFKMFVKGIAW
jgi:serine/threonine protein kinase